MPVILRKRLRDRLVEGYERNQGRFDPGSELKAKTKDPGLDDRKSVSIECKGYTDATTGIHKVAPGHKATYTSFTQDAGQTQNRCDACQKAYRQSYFTARNKRRASGMSR